VEAKPGVGMAANVPAQPTREAIAEAAYFLWLQRGGDELVNWIEAEAMLQNTIRTRV
jgi:hypothetical protein